MPGHKPTFPPPSPAHRCPQTELCRSWEETGSCRYGAKCQVGTGGYRSRDRVEGGGHGRQLMTLVPSCRFPPIALSLSLPPPLHFFFLVDAAV